MTAAAPLDPFSAPVRNCPRGLPEEAGAAPVAVSSAATSAPFPGASPRSVGELGSRFAAIQGMPRRNA